MHLILSSYDFHKPLSKKCILDELNLPLSEYRVLFIPDGESIEESNWESRYRVDLLNYGISRDKLFIFDKSRPSDFTDLDIDIVYISGGNTFSTLNMIRNCGFDKEIVRYVKEGAIYIGGSAGAHIAGQSIEHVLTYDHNDVGLTDFRALELFEGILICHYSKSRESHYLNLTEKGEYKVFRLTDSDSLIVKDGPATVCPNY